MFLVYDMFLVHYVFNGIYVCFLDVKTLSKDIVDIWMKLVQPGGECSINDFVSMNSVVLSSIHFQLDSFYVYVHKSLIKSYSNVKIHRLLLNGQSSFED